MKTWRNWNFSRINVAAGVLLAVLAIGLILSQRKTTLWDFYSYYGAVKAVQAGVDPYNNNYFNEQFAATGNSVGPHAYPPLTLILLKPLAFLSPTAAAVAWCLLKLIALFLTGWIVQRYFFAWTDVPYAVLFLLLGFNAAFYWDLVTGNISLFEQLVIWMGLACLMKDRPGWFTVLIVLTAQIKLPPVLFLGLLLVYDKKPKWGWFAVGAAAFYAVFRLNAVLYPQFMPEFTQAAGRLTMERGVSSASTLIFIRELVDVVGFYHVNMPAHIELWIYTPFLLLTGAASLAIVLRHKQSGSVDRVALLFFFCVVYGIVLPRLKSYQYALMIFPALYLVLRDPGLLSWSLVATMVMFPHPGTGLPGPIQKVIAVCFDYMTIITLYLVWIGYARLLWKPKPQPG
jgi:hypothetical protein